MMNYCPNCGCKLPHGNYTPPVQPYTPDTPYPTYPYWFTTNGVDKSPQITVSQKGTPNGA